MYGSKEFGNSKDRVVNFERMSEVYGNSSKIRQRKREEILRQDNQIVLYKKDVDERPPCGY